MSASPDTPAEFPEATEFPEPSEFPEPIEFPELTQAYARCRALTRRFGTTYYWGAILLPPHARRHVYAVYALCRVADDIVDVPDGSMTAAQTAFTAFRRGFEADLVRGWSAHPVLAATVHTARTVGIDPECFERFFDAMAMDFTVTGYRTWADLCGYMEGSAAVIGEMMLPVLEPLTPAAREPARALGLAFQLTNFLRDVGEDLDRGRVYVPQEDLERFGADPSRRAVTPGWRELMRFEIARNRDLYRQADPGLGMLPPASARCVRTARILYARILDRIEQADYDVFGSRVRVPTWRKAALAGRELVGGRRPNPVRVS